TMLAVVIYTLWRSNQRDALQEEAMGDFILMAPTPLSASLNLDVEEELREEAYQEEPEEIQASFEELVEELEEELSSSDESGPADNQN
ncbi:MAG: hypothetical protein ACPG47_10265, partial [Leucothrix sp.]